MCNLPIVCYLLSIVYCLLSNVPPTCEIIPRPGVEESGPLLTGLAGDVCLGELVEVLVQVPVLLEAVLVAEERALETSSISFHYSVRKINPAEI